jgi:hypothetical protein
MEQLLIMALALVWVILCVRVSIWVYKWKGDRWLQLAVTLFALWLPLWDAIPGYLLFQKAVREIGGVRIYKKVQAKGYLDNFLHRNDCWNFLTSSPYAYCESAAGDSNNSSLGPLNAKAGYYEYRLAPIDAPECAPFREHANVEVMQREYQLGPRCVVATRRDEPVSRYEYLEGEDRLAVSWPSAIAGWSRWTRVRDRVTGEIIAQATSVGYEPWILRWVGNHPFRWGYTRDEEKRSFVLLPQDVINPIH